MGEEDIEHAVWLKRVLLTFKCVTTAPTEHVFFSEIKNFDKFLKSWLPSHPNIHDVEVQSISSSELQSRRQESHFHKDQNLRWM